MQYLGVFPHDFKKPLQVILPTSLFNDIWSMKSATLNIPIIPKTIKTYLKWVIGEGGLLHDVLLFVSGWSLLREGERRKFEVFLQFEKILPCMFQILWNLWYI